MALAMLPLLLVAPLLLLPVVHPLLVLLLAEAEADQSWQEVTVG